MINNIKKSFIIMLFIFIANYAQTEEKVNIKSVIGKVELKSPKSAAWRPARIGMAVRMKWDIRTFVESTVELKFENGTLLKIGENSVINLSTITQDKSSNTSKSNIKISTGNVWGNVKKLVNKNSKFQFETPTAVAAIRGTKLGLNVGRGKTVVDVFEGKVAVRKRGSNREVLLGARKRAVVKKNETDIKTISFDDKKGMAEDSVIIITEALIDSVTAQEIVIDSTLLDSTLLDSTLLDSTLLDSILIDSAIIVDSITYDSSDYKIDESLLDTTFEDTISNTDSIAEYIDSVDNLEIKDSIISNEVEDTIETTEVTKDLFLTVINPSNNIEITEPVINFSGSTNPGAELSIDGNSVSVKSNGSFTYKMPVPDEESDYSIEITASFNGKEITVNRAVSYKPIYQKFELQVSSPLNGAIINNKNIIVSGKSNGGAEININGSTIIAGPDGSFKSIIRITEQDIGDYSIEVSATDAKTGDEKSVDISVIVSNTSPLINISVPKVTLISQIGESTRYNTLNFSVTDLTPDDELTLSIENNNIKEDFDLEPGNKEEVTLDEGLNIYSAKVTDLAGNISNVITGKIYYLPGPLTIDINEPDETMYEINDLPPMPKGITNLQMNVEIEIDDGIGDVNETIKYCRVNGADLKENSQYIYTGRISVNRGINNFTVTTEDIEGNKAIKSFTVKIAD